MYPNHCSDERLVAFLDAGLSHRAAGEVARHLSGCWLCRARLKELEEQALRVGKAVSEDTYPGPDHVAEAIRRFTDWESVVRRQGTPSSRTLPAGRVRWMAIAACVLLLAGVAAWRLAKTPAAAAVLAEARGAEARLLGNEVHQVLRVEVEQLRPVRARRDSRVEVWSSPATGRFASRWQGGDGALRLAAWRPAADRSVVYPAGSPGREPPDLSSLSLLDAASLEDAFGRWLASEQWRPVSFTSRLARFASREGVRLDVARRRGADGRPLLRITAVKAGARLTAECSIEVDAGTYSPRLERLRLESPEAAVELRIAAERIDVIPAARLEPALFEPDVPVVRQAPAPPPPLAPEPPVPQPAPPPAAPIDGEIETWYALHRARSCLGEPVSVERAGDGALVIRGMARTPERRAELLEALAALKEPAWLRLDVRTVEEAMRAGAGSAPYEEPPATVEFADARTPGLELLDRHFRSRGLSGAGLQRAAETLANEAVSQSEAAMQEAWALRRLAERFADTDVAALPPGSQWLLEAMVQDHVRQLRAKLARMRETLSPALPPAGPSGETAAPPGWASSAMEIFTRTDALHRQILGLFAGAGMPVRELDGRLAMLTAEDVAREVPLHLAWIEERLAACEERCLPAGLLGRKE